MPCSSPWRYFQGRRFIRLPFNIVYGGEGFALSFDGIDDFTLSVAWKKMLYCSDSFMLFSPPLPRNRLYSSLFHDVETLSSLSKIFHRVSLETAGDYSASSSLMLAYHKKERDILRGMLNSATSLSEVCSHHEEIPDGETSLIDDIEKRCKEAFTSAACEWMNYQEPLLNDDDYLEWISRAETNFPILWSNLCAFRNVNDRQSKHLVLPKKVQVLHQLLSQIRQRSPAKLKWWGQIESLGLFAWGVGRTAPLLTLCHILVLILLLQLQETVYFQNSLDQIITNAS